MEIANLTMRETMVTHLVGRNALHIGCEYFEAFIRSGVRWGDIPPFECNLPLAAHIARSAQSSRAGERA